MKDNRSVYDVFNFFSDGNYNIHNHKRITEEMYRHYFPYGKECETCKLQKESDVPLCYINCKLWNHWADKIHTHPRVETRQLKNDLLSIYLSRPTFLFNYYRKIPFIFRATATNGLVFHHKNLDKWDDRYENMVLIDMKKHTKNHQEYRIVREKFHDLLNECGNNPSKLDTDKLDSLNIYIYQMKSIMNMPESDRVNKIIYGVITSIKEDRIYVPPKEWANDIGRTKNTKEVIKEKFYKKS